MAVSLSLSSKTKKPKPSIPTHKSIILCAVILLSIQALLISTVYFHLIDKVETTVLNAFTNSSVAKVETTVLNAFKNSGIQNLEQKILSQLHVVSQKSVNKLNREAKRQMYKSLYLTGKRGEIDIITMVKLATEMENISEVVDVNDLPTQEDIHKMYGKKVILEGTDTCEKFRALPDAKRVIAPAGLFNTGTHLLYILMRRNCKMDGKVNFQVPWGKHNPPSWKHRTVARIQGVGVNQDEVLPVVIIKDPINWIHSMCKHPYGGSWRHTAAHCPNLIPNEKDIGKYNDGVVHARVRYNKTHVIPHETLLHIWIDNYNNWLKVNTYPRIFVRYEDLLFQPLVVIQQICECAGGKYTGHRSFNFEDESAKGVTGAHKNASGMVNALKKYGNMEFRKNVISDKRDYDYAKKVLDKEGLQLMTMFGYTLPPPLH